MTGRKYLCWCIRPLSDHTIGDASGVSRSPVEREAVLATEDDEHAAPDVVSTSCLRRRGGAVQVLQGTESVFRREGARLGLVFNRLLRGMDVQLAVQDPTQLHRCGPRTAGARRPPPGGELRDLVYWC